MKTDVEIILQANAAYYRAFAKADFRLMAGLWASEHDISVIHPGWAPLHGREQVMQSWRSILSGEGEPHLRCLDANAYLMGDAALVICTESLPQASLVATNVFVRENGQWKIVHHQAGPVAQQNLRMPDGGTIH